MAEVNQAPESLADNPGDGTIADAIAAELAALDAEASDNAPDEGNAAPETAEAEEQSGEADEAASTGEEEAPAPRLTRQFGRPWAAPRMNNQMDEQDTGGYEEEDQPYDDGDEQDDGNAWESEQPIEEAPMPRPSLRLRPKPWEQPDRSGRTRW